jgi:hypothetical protein
MKIKIQKTDGTITFERIRPNKRNLKRNLADLGKDLFETAELFFETFPRFKEIVFNTEITEDYE